MNNFIKQVIEETFASKKQQRYFYSKASDKTLKPKERKKWEKWSKEFSDKTDFKKLPEKVKKDVDEIVDNNGDFISGSKDGDANTKGVTSKSTTDNVTSTGMGMMGAFGLGGAINTSKTLKYWAESDMSKTLGYQDTLGQDIDYNSAKDHFEDNLGLPDDEAEERIEMMGYDPKLPKGKIRLIENPNEYIEQYIETILRKKNKINDIVKKDTLESKTVNPIIKKQITSLKQTLKDNKLTVNDITKYLEEDDE